MSNLIKRGATALLLIFPLLQTAASMAANSESGLIAIYSDEKLICRLKIEAGQTAVHLGENGCDDSLGGTGAIKLENARSAATITLSSNYGWNTKPGCSNMSGLKFILRTIKAEVTTDKITVRELMQYNTGQPVVPGLLLKQKHLNEDSSRFSIGCVTIAFD